MESTPAPTSEEPEILYLATLKLSLSNLTFDQFNDEMRTGVKTIMIDIATNNTTISAKYNVTYDDVDITSIDEKTVVDSKSRRYLRYRKIQASNDTTTPLTSAIVITIELGFIQDCSYVEWWASSVYDKDLTGSFQNYSVPVSEVSEEEPFQVVATNTTSNIVIKSAYSCGELDVFIEDQQSGSGLSSRHLAAIISSVVLVFLIILFIIVGFRLTKRKKKLGLTYVAAHSSHSARARYTTDNGNIVIDDDEQNEVNEWSIVDLKNADIRHVLTLESTFGNAHAKECLRWYMQEFHMEEAYLFYEKMSDKILRPYFSNDSPEMMAQFKQQIINEFIVVGALHQLNISDGLRRKTLRSTSKELSSLVPVLKEVHRLILDMAWVNWISSEPFSKLMSSNQMRLAKFTQVADSQSQLFKASHTAVGEYLEFQEDDITSYPNTSSKQGPALLCPLWGSIKAPKNKSDCPRPSK